MNGRKRAYTVGGHIHPTGHLLFRQQPRSQGCLQADGHPCAGLPRADHDNFSNPSEGQLRLTDEQAIALRADLALDEAIAADRVDGGLPDRKGVISERLSHFASS
jgi:hypothetical protein